MPEVENIAVIGAGLMGRGIAQVFACYGHPVWLVDTEEKILKLAKEQVEKNLKQMLQHGISFSDEIEEVLDRISTTTDMVRACEGCDFVVEAVYENLDLKQQVFADLDRFCPPEAILCSNTSVIAITEIAERASKRERILGTHWWNPPYLIPLVEVVRAEETADRCIDATYDLLTRVGKHPVRIHKDVPGFVGNRLQHALWREAFAIIDEGICDPATVDEVVCSGFGLRLPILGPVENADMVGLDLTLSIHDYILKYLNANPTPSTTLRSRVEQKHLGFKTGKGFQEWSDAEVAASRERLTNYLMKVISQEKSRS
ncbi:MAG: 3-hydroxyacyl-CoA dehydrogenase family protein [Deltaproteobacteria bacterium]|nr:3-hydroxyacyl-CoA dehydrogenase family protein [Deltaproteobacteria bacterium]